MLKEGYPSSETLANSMHVLTFGQDCLEPPKFVFDRSVQGIPDVHVVHRFRKMGLKEKVRLKLLDCNFQYCTAA